MGTEKLNKGATLTDVVAGLSWFAQLIELLPELRLVVTMGEIARRSFALYLLMPEARLIPWFAVAHPSSRVEFTNPALWKDIHTAFEKATEIVRDDRSELPRPLPRPA